MGVYVAHYKSLQDAHPVSGEFEFESDSRAGSKANQHDARMRMLETYGAEAVSWRITDIHAVKAKSASDADQMQLDFREAVKPKKTHRVQRGRV